MDSTTFDTVARNFGSSLTRRTALRGLFASALAVTAGGSALETSARRKKRRKNPTGPQKYLRPGAFCQTSSQCQPTYICDVAVDAGNSDRTCCGATNAACGAPNDDGDDTAPFCCAGYRCRIIPGNATGVCEPIPEFQQ